MKKIFCLLVVAMMVMVSCDVTPVEPEIPVSNTFYVGAANGFGGGLVSDTSDLAYMDFMKDSLVFRFYFNMLEADEVSWPEGAIETDLLLPHNLKFVAKGDTTILPEAKLVYQIIETDSDKLYRYTMISGIGDTIWQDFPWDETEVNDLITRYNLW